MNKHIKNIIANRDKNLSLFENIMTYLHEHKNEMDASDIAEIIKEDKTFYETLESECLDDRLLKKKPVNFVKLTEIFEGGDVSK